MVLWGRIFLAVLGLVIFLLKGPALPTSMAINILGADCIKQSLPWLVTKQTAAGLHECDNNTCDEAAQLVEVCGRLLAQSSLCYCA